MLIKSKDLPTFENTWELADGIKQLFPSGQGGFSVVVRTPLSDIGPSSVNNAGSSNFNCGNKVSSYTNVYVRRSKKGKGEMSEACGLGGFCN